METSCKTCIHKEVCSLWRREECQDASCFQLDGCDYYREAAARWIPVTERLPKRFVEVLVVSDGCVIYGYLGYMGLWFTGINSTLGSVTHWMPTPPTPEPPKEEDDDENDIQ